MVLPVILMQILLQSKFVIALPYMGLKSFTHQYALSPRKTFMQELKQNCTVLTVLGFSEISLCNCCTRFSISFSCPSPLHSYCSTCALASISFYMAASSFPQCTIFGSLPALSSLEVLYKYYLLMHEQLCFILQ
jgi:hypothetical protein